MAGYTNDTGDFETEFRREIERVLGSAPETIVMDGKFYRFSVKGHKGKPGFYIGHRGPPERGGYGNWAADGGKIRYWPDKPLEQMTADERKQAVAQREKDTVQWKKKRAELNAEARRKAETILKHAKPANKNHPYLASKGILPHGIFTSEKGDLVIPLRNVRGELQSLEFIGEDGSKRFLFGGAKKGNFHRIEKAKKAPDRVFVVEGYATGASIHEATGCEVIVGLDAGNLLPVAKNIRAKCPAAHIVICGDDDRWKEDNAGRKGAKVARDAVGADLFFPLFKNLQGKKTTDFNDLHQREGLEEVRRQVFGEKREPVKREPKTPDEKWEYARKAFPPVPFPWRVLPSGLVDSLKRLARSCATNPVPLVGVMIVIIASLLGGTVGVMAKAGWIAVFIFWFIDIQGVGAGKSPPANKLMEVVHGFQIEEEEACEVKRKEWLKKDKDKRGSEPRSRGFFVADLTIEGLRNDISGHGGTICHLDEISSFINGMDQYRGGKGGTDGATWRTLWRGAALRVVRALKTLFLWGTRISITGGIQPKRWAETFGGKFIDDGTVARFLLTCVSPAFYPSDDTTWDGESSKLWEDLAKRARAFGDSRTCENRVKKHTLILNEEARGVFRDWVNDLKLLEPLLPEEVWGFVPKAFEYALRLTGILYCIRRFVIGAELGKDIRVEDVQRGIALMMFYLGQAVKAMALLVGRTKGAPVPEMSEQQQWLIKTLRGLEVGVENGRLTFSLILEKYNETCPPELKIKTSKAMGCMLRSVGFSTARDYTNNHRGASCIPWDKKTKRLIETHSQSAQSALFVQNQEVKGARFENPTCAKCAGVSPGDEEKRTLRTLKKQSALVQHHENTGKAHLAHFESLTSPSGYRKNGNMETLETLENQRLHTQPTEITHIGDVGDIGDVVSGQEPEPNPPREKPPDIPDSDYKTQLSEQEQKYIESAYRNMASEPQQKHLINTLRGFGPELDNGYLNARYICDRYNENRPPGIKPESAKTIGTLLWDIGFIAAGDQQDADRDQLIINLPWNEENKTIMKLFIMAFPDMESESEPPREKPKVTTCPPKAPDQEAPGQKGKHSIPEKCKNCRFTDKPKTVCAYGVLVEFTSEKPVPINKAVLNCPKEREKSKKD